MWLGKRSSVFCTKKGVDIKFILLCQSMFQDMSLTKSCPPIHRDPTQCSLHKCI